MAQDFGDEMGKALIDFVSRSAADYLRRLPLFGQSAAKDWWQEKYEEDGLSPENAAKGAATASERTQVIVPFVSSEEAAYYAQVCRESGIYAAAYTDTDGAACNHSRSAPSARGSVLRVYLLGNHAPPFQDQW